MTLNSPFSYLISGSISTRYFAATAFGLFPRNVSSENYNLNDSSTLLINSLRWCAEITKDRKHFQSNSYYVKIKRIITQYVDCLLAIESLTFQWDFWNSHANVVRFAINSNWALRHNISISYTHKSCRGEGLLGKSIFFTFSWFVENIFSPSKSAWKENF